jgi:hypothetical protein
MLRFAIQINDQPAAYSEDMGWALAGIELLNQQPDVATLTRVRDGIGEAVPIAAGDRVLIAKETEEGVSTLIFYGTAQGPQVRCSAGDVSVVVRVLGPWRDLERRVFTRTLLDEYGGFGEIEIGDIIYLSTYTDPIPIEIATVLDFTSSPVKIPPAWLIDARGHLYDPHYVPAIAYRTLKEQLEELFDYVIARMDDEPGGATFQYDPALHFEFPDATPRPRTFQDERVANLVIQGLALRPDAAVWYDYTTTPPTMHIRSASNEVPEALTLGDGGLEDLDGETKPELVPSGVVVRHQTEMVGGYYRGWTIPIWFEWYPPEAKADDADVVTSTFIASVDTWAYGGLPQKLYEAMAVLRFAGTATVTDEAMALDMRPGRVFTVAGDDESLDYGQLLVQSAAYNPAAGHWKLTFGLPEVLGLAEMKDLRPWLLFRVCGPGWVGLQRLPLPPGSV